MPTPKPAQGEKQKTRTLRLGAIADSFLEGLLRASEETYLSLPEKHLRHSCRMKVGLPHPFRESQVTFGAQVEGTFLKTGVPLGFAVSHREPKVNKRAVLFLIYLPRSVVVTLGDGPGFPRETQSKIGIKCDLTTAHASIEKTTLGIPPNFAQHEMLTQRPSMRKRKILKKRRPQFHLIFCLRP